MDSPSRRFASRRNLTDSSPSPLSLSSPNLSPSLPAADSPRRRNLPNNNSIIRDNSKSPLANSVRAPLSPSSSSSSVNNGDASPRNRFRKDPSQRTTSSPILDPPQHSRDTSKRTFQPSPMANGKSAQDLRAEQIIQEWDLPRKRGQTPVSEAKFYAQMEKVSAFMRMLQQKEFEEEEARKRALAENPQVGPAPPPPPRTLDLLSPDYEGTRIINVKSDILAGGPNAVASQESGDLINFNSPQPARTGRFGAKSVSSVDLNASSSSYSPILDMRKQLRTTTIDVKYSHRAELDEIEMEMSFLLQSATNSVLNILPKDVLELYFDILVFFGSRSELWCRHALTKISEHLELEIVGKELGRLPLHELQIEDSLEGMWAASEKIIAKMMNYITLDHLFGNLQKKVTNRSYENIVKMIFACIPAEAEGAARPDRLLEQSQETTNNYFRFLFTDLWNLHPCLHPVIIKRLDTYLQQESIKPLIMRADLSGISPHSLTSLDGIRYLRRLQTLQRLDRLITIPTMISLLKTSRLSGNDDRIRYSHGLINCYSELMNPATDVQAKPEKMATHMTGDEIIAYSSMLMDSYIELRGVVMFRHAILSRLADYIKFGQNKESVIGSLGDAVRLENIVSFNALALGDVRKLEVLYHFILLQTYVHNWEKFDAFNTTQLKESGILDSRLQDLAASQHQQQQQQEKQQQEAARLRADSHLSANGEVASPRSYRRKRHQAGKFSTAAIMTSPMPESARLEEDDGDDEGRLISKENKGKQKSMSSLEDPDSDESGDEDHDREYLLAKPPIYMDIGSVESIPSLPAVSIQVSSAIPRKRTTLSMNNEELDAAPDRTDTIRRFIGGRPPKAPLDAPAYDSFQNPQSPANDAYRALAEALEQQLPSPPSNHKEEEPKDEWGDVIAVIDNHQKSRSNTGEPPRPIAIDMPMSPPGPRAADIAKSDITVIRSRASTTATQHQVVRTLVPQEGAELPADLAQLMAEQAELGSFLATQNFVVFPRRKEQAALYLREFQVHIMPTFLKTYRMDSLVEIPGYIERLRYMYLEEFEFLDIPMVQLSKIYYQFSEMFFVLHYTDDVLMEPKVIWQDEELVRTIIHNLRTRWVATPGFELLAFKRLSSYVEDERMRHIVHPLNFIEWDLLNLFLKIRHSPYLEHTDEQVKEIAVTVLPALLHHYPLNIVVTSEKLRATLKEFNSPDDKAIIGEFFEFAFNLTNEAFAQPQCFAANESTFLPYLEYILNLSSLWVNVKLLVLERLRVYVQCYSTDILTKYIAEIDPSAMVLSDIDVKVLDKHQKEKLCEDLSVLFSLWEFKSFYPKHSNRVDMNNTEFLNRKRALLSLLWNYSEATSGIDWDFKAKGVHERSWSLNVWLYGWPSFQDQALLMALKYGGTSKTIDPKKFPSIVSKLKGVVKDFQASQSPNMEVEMVSLADELSDTERESPSDLEKSHHPLVWRELDGHPGVMWAGIIFRGVRLRFLKAVDRKSMDAVMGTVGSDVPAHAMWRFVPSMADLHTTLEKSKGSDLKWGGLVMPIIFVVGDRACPYHPEFLRLKKEFSHKKDDVLLCGAMVEPIYLTPAQTNIGGSETRLRGVPNLISATMALYYDTPYAQNTNRYATFLSRHMWLTLHAWAIAIYGIIFIWNIVQCAFGLSPNIGQYVLFGLWMLALVFVSFFVELSVAAKSPKYLGPFHPSGASNLIVRTVLLIVLLFFGLGEFYYADKMVNGHPYKHCMPLGVADFVMVNVVSHLHIVVKRVLFNFNFHPERAV